MPRGKKIDAEEIDGWMMRRKKPIPSRGEMIYYCIERNGKYKCPGAFGVNLVQKEYRVVQEHRNHDQDSLTNSKTFARQELKNRASSGTCREVIDSVRQDYGANASMAAGGYDAKRRIIHRAKAIDSETSGMNKGGPISTLYSSTINRTPFLRCDKNLTVKDRMLIFASDLGLQLLTRASVLLVDGTFDCTPKGFTQLFTFHVYITENDIRPVLFALLPNKQLSTYEFMIDEIRSFPFMSTWNPQLLISDFELNIHHSFTSKFSSVSISGCYFHLIQCWRRYAQKLGIYSMFYDGYLSSMWKLLKVLPFVMDGEIPRYFDLIIVSTLEMPLTQKVTQYVEYVSKFYINGNAQTQSPPRFPPSLWSCNDRISNSIHRTTNCVESWHRQLQYVATANNGYSSLLLSDLLKKVQSEERHCALDWEELQRNPSFQVSRKRIVSNLLKDRRIRVAVENLPPAGIAPLSGIDLLHSFVIATS